MVYYKQNNNIKNKVNFVSISFCKNTFLLFLCAAVTSACYTSEGSPKLVNIPNHNKKVSEVNNSAIQKELEEAKKRNENLKQNLEEKE